VKATTLLCRRVRRRKQLKVGNGIKIRQLDHTLEILVQTKAGASVTVQPGSNHLNLGNRGKLDPRPVGVDANNTANPSATDAANRLTTPPKRKASKRASPLSQRQEPFQFSGGTAAAKLQAQGPAAGSTSPANQAGPSSTDKPIQQRSPGRIVGLFSVTTLFLILVVGLLALVFIRWRQSRSRQPLTRNGDEPDSEFAEIAADNKGKLMAD